VDPRFRECARGLNGVLRIVDREDGVDAMLSEVGYGIHFGKVIRGSHNPV
jgi:hypothetical protein